MNAHPLDTLREAKREAGLTWPALAHVLGESKHSVQHWLTDRPQSVHGSAVVVAELILQGEAEWPPVLRDRIDAARAAHPDRRGRPPA